MISIGIPAISKHLANIFESGELDAERVVSILEITTQHGALIDKTQTREAKVYNLDAIISVGSRVNSLKATRFRQWATKVLREFMTKGFVLDDERLKQGETLFGKDYFKELLERVRSIRASERRIWLQITDITLSLRCRVNCHGAQVQSVFLRYKNDKAYDSRQRA